MRESRDIGILLLILKGDRPARPTHPTFTEHLWGLIQRCWAHDPGLRPEASEVLRILLTPASVFRSLSIHMD